MSLSNPLNVIKSLNNSSTSNVGGESTITSELSAGATTIDVTDHSIFPSSGTVRVGNEYIIYTGAAANQLTGCTRGSFQTTDATHSNGSAIWGVYIGTAEQNAQPNVMCDVVSTSNGKIYMDFSDDGGTTWYSEDAAGASVLANVFRKIVCTKLIRHYRTRYENYDQDGTATLTTSLIIGTYFGTFGDDSYLMNRDSNLNSFIGNVISGGSDLIGKWEDVSKYATITVLGDSSANASLFCQFSMDGTTITRDLRRSTGTDTALGLHDLIVVAKYFRIKITNEDVGNNTVNLQTIYNNGAKVCLPTSTANQTIGEYSDALNVRNIQMGKQPD